MSSPAWITQEAQALTAVVTPLSQKDEAPAGEPETSLSDSITPPTVISPVGGLTNEEAAPARSSTGSCLSVTVAGPSTPVAVQPTPRGPPHAIANETLQEPIRAKFLSSPGYVVPAPSFSYSVFPMMSSASGNLQQSLSSPVVKLAPPLSPAALQPPAPGQAFGNRPSFSYSIASQPNVRSANGQQFRPATVSNQAPLLGGKVSPRLNAASLQPPVPGQFVRPSLNISGTNAQNISPPMQMPLYVPKGQFSTSTGFPLSGSSQEVKVEDSDKNLFTSSTRSEDVQSESGAASAGLLIFQLPQSSANLPASSSTSSASTANMNSSSVLMTTASSLPGYPGPPVRALGPPNAASFTLATTGPVTTMNSFPPTHMLPSPVSASSNPISTPIPVLQNVQHHIYPPHPSLLPLAATSQPLWSHPPQPSGLQRAPFLPFPGAAPVPSPQPMLGAPAPYVPFANVQPPGASTVGAQKASTTASTSQPGSTIDAELPPDHDKQSNDHTDGVSRTEEADAWTAHKTDAGVVYYYNSVTGKSTYEKPSCFKEEKEKVASQPTPVSWEKLAGTDWTLVTTNDGKNYYYDTKNKVSSWKLPPEVAELKKTHDSVSLKVNENQVQNASLLADKGSLPVSLSSPALNSGGRESVVLRTSAALVSSSALDLIKKKLQDAGTPTTSSPLLASSGTVTLDSNGSRAVDASLKAPQCTISKDTVKEADGNVSDSSSDSDDAESGATKEDCIIQFREMLKERGVAPFSKWEKELPKIVFDPRFKAVPGYSTRRSLFEHFVRTRAEEERKEKRAALKAAVEGFRQLLEEASEDIDHRTDYETFKKRWGSDTRFMALERKEQEVLLNEKILPLKKAAEEKIHATRMATVSSFKSMLREKGDINTNSRWSRVKERLRNDPRYKVVKHEDREILFNEYISQLKATEAEEERAAKAKRDEQEKLKERERELRKRKEREEQEMERIRLKIHRKEAVSSYQALLVETIKDPKASWTESKLKLEKDPQGRGTNPDLGQPDLEKLFREHVKDLFERCARDFRSLLAEVITAEAAAQTTSDGKNVLNSWLEAKHLLKPDPRYSKMPRKDRESFWSRYAEELVRRQKSAASDPKDKLDTKERNKTSSQFSRSLKRSHSRK